MSFYCANQAQLAPYCFGACQSPQFIGQNLRQNEFYPFNAMLGSFSTNSSPFYSFVYQNIESGPAKDNPVEEFVKFEADIVDHKKMVTMSKKKREQKKDGNAKANIIRDFIRNVRKDATSILLAKKFLKEDYPIKKFMEILQNNFGNERKYIRFSQVKALCVDSSDRQFARLFRVCLFNFLRGEYLINIILKKKNKIEYLKASQQIIHRLSCTDE